MPGKGKMIEREHTTDERKATERGADQSVLELLGEKTDDVYLNDMAYCRNIPARVWDYTIGGYQVIKKWLSYANLNCSAVPFRRHREDGKGPTRASPLAWHIASATRPPTFSSG